MPASKSQIDHDSAIDFSKLTKKKLSEADHKIIQAELCKSELPRHIAIIMDGNGRWAKSRGLPRLAGHNEGVKSVKDITEGCGELGIEVLTLYAFSQENWKRPSWEVSALMKLLMRTILNEIDNLNTRNVRVKTIGHIDMLPADTLKQVTKAMDVTKNNTGLVLNLALSYSGRIEIIDAVKRMARSGTVDMDQLDESTLSGYLDTSDLPDPDLVIRTSGEFRVSNFLLWQIAYAELYITEIFWPDFRKPQLYQAVKDYQQRERRFGKVSEQVVEEKKHKKK